MNSAFQDSAGDPVCSCDTGYKTNKSGACDACVPGYTKESDGTCTPACDLGPCGDHGVCTLDSSDQPVCTCDTGYADDGTGACDACAAAYTDDGSGACVDVCSVTDCGPGSCVVQSDVAVCECPTEYTGDACESCASGYATAPTGACVDVCSLTDCGPGVCEADGNNAVCRCPKEYTGDLCDSCASGYDWSIVMVGETSTCVVTPPSTTNMKLWLDANEPTSFSYYLTTQEVTTWSSLVGSSLDFTAPGSSNRPLQGLVHNGDTLPGVIFDGANDGLNKTADLSLGSYSIFIVAEVADSALVQTLFSGVGGGSWGVWLRAADNGQTLQMRHANTDGSATENAEVTGVDLTDRSLIEVHRSGLALSVGADGQSSSVLLSANPLGSLDLVFGRRADAGTNPLNGAIYEVIVVSPAVSNANRPAYQDYLKAKWEL